MKVKCRKSNCKYKSNDDCCTKDEIEINRWMGCTDFIPKVNGKTKFTYTRYDSKNKESKDISVKVINIDVELNYYNSARNQGECPHCGKKAKDGFWYNPVDDSDAFLGILTRDMLRDLQKYDSSRTYILVYRCTECHEIFWLHDNISVEE